MRTKVKFLVLALLAVASNSSAVDINSGYNAFSISTGAPSQLSGCESAFVTISGGSLNNLNIESDMENFNGYRGYITRADSSCSLAPGESSSSSESVTLSPGWNLISWTERIEASQVAELSSCFDSAPTLYEMSFPTNEVNNIEVEESSEMIPSKAYLVNVDQQCEFISRDLISLSLQEALVQVDTGSEGTENSANDGANQEQNTRSAGQSVEAGEVSRPQYSRFSVDWNDFTPGEKAALAGVKRGDMSTINLRSSDSLLEGVRQIRQDSMNYAPKWQEGYDFCSSLGNPESCSSDGNSFYVSSAEGWVLEEGTPAPHCYSEYSFYTPPEYSRHSKKIDVKESSTSKDVECPSWLSEEMRGLKQEIRDFEEEGSVPEPVFKVYQSSGEVENFNDAKDANFRVYFEEGVPSDLQLSVWFKGKRIASRTDCPENYKYCSVPKYRGNLAEKVREKFSNENDDILNGDAFTVKAASSDSEDPDYGQKKIYYWGDDLK